MSHSIMAYEVDPNRNFEGLVRPLLGGLRSAALRLTRNRADADDLLQESMLRAWRFWHHYTPDSNLRAWLHRILRNAFINRYRRACRERTVMAEARVVAESRVVSTEPAALRNALSDEVERSLGELPAEFRAVLWAVDVEELSYREAAASLDCPIGTVMSRLHRARHGLAHALAPSAGA